MKFLLASFGVCSVFAATKCTKDSCLPNQYCSDNNHKCTATKKLGATCNTQQKCENGLLCFKNKCSANPISIAMFGDWPYNKNLLNNQDLLINSVNNNGVQATVHVGDIHAGSMACTSAGILPTINGSAPEWNQLIYSAFQKFTSPVIYTPGDNEWADCHKKKQFSSGASPLHIPITCINCL
jgi:hypothetical protein